MVCVASGIPNWVARLARQDFHALNVVNDVPVFCSARPLSTLERRGLNLLILDLAPGHGSLLEVGSQVPREFPRWVDVLLCDRTNRETSTTHWAPVGKPISLCYLHSLSATLRPQPQVSR